MTVYVVEDDAAVRDAIMLFAAQLGHEARGFSDAEGFLGAALPTSGDFVIVDIGLPGLDGAHVIRWMSALADPPKVLAITGQSQTMIRDFLEGLPDTDVLRKPISAVELSAYL